MKFFKRRSHQRSWIPNRLNVLRHCYKFLVQLYNVLGTNKSSLLGLLYISSVSAWQCLRTDVKIGKRGKSKVTTKSNSMFKKYEHLLG